MSPIIELFEDTLENLKVANADQIKARRDEITRSLNKHFRSSNSDTLYRLMVGSWGRHTAIDGVSDLDMIYILPPSLRGELHKTGGSRKALQRTKSAIAKHYSTTSITVDHLVVVVQFSDFKFEIQPCFENSDGSFEYPDTYSDSWKRTDPRAEIEAMRNLNDETSGNARILCRLARAWRRKHDVEMNGLLIDTLVWRFFDQTRIYREPTLLYDQIALEFFTFLSQLPKQEKWNALGSRQVVKVKKNFQGKAKKAAELCSDAIASEEKASIYTKWRKVFGRFVPANANSRTLEPREQYQDTEQFIEDFYPLDIQHDMQINCTVTQNGFRPMSLKYMLQKRIWLRPSEFLHFEISTTVPEPFELRWKVLNRGEEAERLDCVRGQIIKGAGKRDHQEHTDFRGDHYVECYVIQNGVVVAQSRIDVPIRWE